VVFEQLVALLGLDESWIFSFSTRPTVSESSAIDSATLADMAGDLVVVILLMQLWAHLGELLPLKWHFVDHLCSPRG